MKDRSTDGQGHEDRDTGHFLHLFPTRSEKKKRKKKEKKNPEKVIAGRDGHGVHTRSRGLQYVMCYV